MELEKYISSGILERYVLGNTSPEENKELEGYVKRYPELKAELETLQDAIEAYAKAHAITPPAELKEKVMAAIDAIEAGTYKAVEKDPIDETQQEETKVIPMRKPDYFRWVAAASIALLIASAAYNYKQYNELKDKESQLASLQAKNDIMADETEMFKTRLQKSDNLLAAISSPDNIIVTMNSANLEKAPGALANVYYNKNTKEAFMTIGSLPNPPADKQYQLWGVKFDAAGNPLPTDMGVFDVGSGIIKMKNMPTDVDAFAVTLEPKGGSKAPNLDEMYVIGKI